MKIILFAIKIFYSLIPNQRIKLLFLFCLFNIKPLLNDATKSTNTFLSMDNKHYEELDKKNDLKSGFHHQSHTNVDAPSILVKQCRYSQDNGSDWVDVSRMSKTLNNCSCSPKMSFVNESKHCCQYVLLINNY